MSSIEAEFQRAMEARAAAIDQKAEDERLAARVLEARHADNANAFARAFEEVLAARDEDDEAGDGDAGDNDAG